MNFLRIGTKASFAVRGLVRSPLPRGLATVADNTIRITFVDQEGNRVTTPVRIGRTLLEEARMRKVDLEGPCRGGGGPPEVRRTENWTETTYGEGPQCFYCHVQIPSSFHHLLDPPFAYETTGLSRVWGEEANTASRLACQITLEKKHDGMVVFVPDMPPVDLC